MVSREEVPGGWGAGGAHSYEVLESDQHSEICSEPLIFSWFVINCPLHHRGVQLITNLEKNGALEESLLCWTHFAVRS